MVAVNAEAIIASMPDATKANMVYSGKTVKGVKGSIQADHVNSLYGESSKYTFSFWYATAQLKGVTIDNGKRTTIGGTQYLVLAVYVDPMNALTRVDLGDKYA